MKKLKRIVQRQPMQKKQEGNYWDSFITLDMDYDKRNQKFQTNSGFKSYYSVDLPIISETNTIKNYYNYSQYFNFLKKTFLQFQFILSQLIL
jgi:outer membrane protein insertion porin family